MTYSQDGHKIEPEGLVGVEKDWLLELIGEWNDNPIKVVKGELSYEEKDYRVLAQAIRKELLSRLPEDSCITNKERTGRITATVESLKDLDMFDKLSYIAGRNEAIEQVRGVIE